MSGNNVDDGDLIRFNLPKCDRETELVWLLGNYVDMIWRNLYMKGKSSLKLDEFFGFLKFKYKEDQQGARPFLHHIPGLI